MPNITDLTRYKPYSIKETIIQVQLPVVISNVAMYNLDSIKIIKYYERIIAINFYANVLKQISATGIKKAIHLLNRGFGYFSSISSIIGIIGASLLLKHYGSNLKDILNYVFFGEKSINLRKKITTKRVIEQDMRPPASESGVSITQVKVSDNLKLQFISNIIPNALTEKAPNILLKGLMENKEFYKKFFEKVGKIYVSEDIDIIMVGYEVPGIIITSPEIEKVNDIKHLVNLIVVDPINNKIIADIILSEKIRNTFSTDLSSLVRKPMEDNLTINSLIEILRGTRKL